MTLATKNRVMLHRNGDDDPRIFGPLRFVDRRRIGGKERIELAEGIFDVAPSKLATKGPSFSSMRSTVSNFR